MTIKEFANLSPDEQSAWLKSDEHRRECAAWKEGLDCCLEKLAGFKVVGTYDDSRLQLNVPRGTFRNILGSSRHKT